MKQGIDMKLDVLLPVHGEAKFISETLISILDDLDLKDNLIVVCDRLATSTKALVEYFAENDRRIRILDSPGSGIVNALNCGILYSEADFIARIDADDIVMKGRFSRQKKFLISHSKHVLVGSNIQTIDSFGEKLGLKKFPNNDNSIKRMLYLYNSIAHPTVMYRRISVIKAGLYDERYEGCEDYDLWIKLITIGKFKNLRKPLIKYRIHKNQSSLKINYNLIHEIQTKYRSINNLNLDKIDVLLEDYFEKKLGLRFYLNPKNINYYIYSLINNPKIILELTYLLPYNSLRNKLYLKIKK
jgi:glycosyltransferase involved in cell wall biosynthesis